MHLAEPAVGFELFQIPTHRHVRNAQQLGQLADPDATGALDRSQDELTTLGSQHG